jgi:hypothetical protein
MSTFNRDQTSKARVRDSVHLFLFGSFPNFKIYMLLSKITWYLLVHLTLDAGP